MLAEQPPGISENLSAMWVSSLGFLAGAILVLSGSLLLPRADDIADIQAMQAVFGDQAIRLQACALLITIGFWAILAGSAGLQQSMRGNGATWIHIGFIFHITGTAIWTVGMSLDIAYPAAIVNWLAAAPDETTTAYSVVTVLSPLGLGRGLFPLNVMLNWLAFACLATGLIRCQGYPAWVGGYGLIVGCCGGLLGIVMTFTGREALVEFFILLMAITIIWWITLGIVIARKARQIPRRPTQILPVLPH